MNKKLKQFMLESNRIEGEDRINPGDLKAAHYAIYEGIYTIEDLHIIHGILGEYLNQPWVGKFRDVQVYVGGYTPPAPEHIARLADEYMDNYGNMDSFTAHNEFEMGHFYTDLNGRMGRLIWLSKEFDRGYDFSLSFLHSYYYQTLEHYENK